jgi:hypothetical protein
MLGLQKNVEKRKVFYGLYSYVDIPGYTVHIMYDCMCRTFVLFAIRIVVKNLLGQVPILLLQTGIAVLVHSHPQLRESLYIHIYSMIKVHMI